MDLLEQNQQYQQQLDLEIFLRPKTFSLLRNIAVGTTYCVIALGIKYNGFS